jgi:methyltransferase (TIGR00027 family)
VQNRTSRTAAHVALFRALETARPRQRIFSDPFAAAFLPTRYRLFAQLARVRPIGQGLERYIDRRWPGGPRASAVARTRLIDDLLDEALAGAVDPAGGISQVLLLGAGYDSRAYRIPAMASVDVFEVDHPATQATKQRLLRAHLPAERRQHVRLVPVDLNTDDLGSALRHAGFVAQHRTVVIWEGVTNYLTANAVDATLRQLADLTGTGSLIIFTYIDQAALDGTGGFAGADGWHAAVTRHGEPWTFGFDPDALPGYLAARDLALTLDLTTRDAAARYLAPLGRDEPTAAFYRIARAEVR